MFIPIDILILVSGTGALQSGFFGVYLLSIAKSHKSSIRILCALLIASTFRIIESVSYFIPPNIPIVPLGNMGFACHVSIAPLLYFYVRSSIEKDFAFKRSYLLHFVPAFLVLIFAKYLGDEFWFGSPKGFLLTLIYFGIYVSFGFYSLIANQLKGENKISRVTLVWLVVLNIGMTLVWGTYGAALVLELISCINGPFVFSCLIYGLSFFGLTHHKMFLEAETPSISYKDSSLEQTEIEKIANQITEYVVIEKGYRDSSISLPKLAKRLAVSKHIVSEVINRHFQMSFINLVNTYRIKEAKQKLMSPQYSDMKIMTIAFECGFGTYTAFNGLFKKHTNMTPSAFRKQFQTDQRPKL